MLQKATRYAGEIKSLSGKLYYCWCEELQAPVFEKDESSLWSNDYSDITKCGWDAFHECLLKIVVYPGDEEFEVMFIAHHLLGDGRSILSLVCEFADCYISGENPAHAEETLIMSIDELPKGTQLSAISKLLIRYANRKWKNEDQIVNYAFATAIEVSNKSEDIESVAKSVSEKVKKT